MQAVAEGKEPILPIRDNQGENISYLNPYYCELTVQYWAWKNVDCNYYGFAHYRRFFNFNKNVTYEESTHLGSRRALDPRTFNDLKIDEDMEKEIEGYDAVFQTPTSMKLCGYDSVYDQYKKSDLYIKDLDLAIKLIDQCSPIYSESAIKYLYGENGVFFNMFIMKKDLFNKYCEWLFMILEKFCEANKMENYSVETFRTPWPYCRKTFWCFSNLFIRSH